jgi:NAD(P)H-flavin reductase
MQERPPWFSFVPVLSRAGSDWNGRTGFVQRAALADHPDALGVDVYACGNPLMVSAALRELREEAGLAAANFYAHTFVATGGPPTLPLASRRDEHPA